MKKLFLLLAATSVAIMAWASSASSGPCGYTPIKNGRCIVEEDGLAIYVAPVEGLPNTCTHFFQ